MLWRKVSLKHSNQNYGYKLKPKAQLKLEIFDYIECWYNKKRRHSALDNLTIDEFNNEYNKYSKNVA